MTPTRREFLSALGAAALLPRTLLAAQSPPQKLNFLFILIDDFGYSDLACYGNPYHQTPNIDRLAKEGIRFTDGYAACPVCSPTRASFITGLSPARLRLTNYLVGNLWPKNSPIQPVQWQHFLPPETQSLPRILKSLGYTTAHIGKWHLGLDHDPTDFGFDLNIAGGQWGAPPSYFSPYKNDKLPDGPEGEYLTDRLTTEAERFLEQNKDRPFFLHLAHYATHIPLKAKPDLIKKYENITPPTDRITNPIYAAMTESVDDCVGRLMKKLDELGIADRTVVIFTSDNGGLSVKEGPAIPTSNTPLRAGKGHLHEGGIRTPWIVRCPSLIKPDSTSDQPIISTDLLPTLVDLAGAPNLLPNTLDGQSFAPALKNQSMPLRPLFWHYPHYSNQGGKPGSVVRLGDFKLIHHLEADSLDLYNLKSDLSEKTNLAKTLPDKTSQLKTLLDTWRTSVNAQIPAKAPATRPSTEPAKPPQ